MSVWCDFTEGDEILKEKTNFVLSGVGGQGVVTAANLLGKAAVRAKVEVFTSEVHGMAQRRRTRCLRARGRVIRRTIVAYYEFKILIRLIQGAFNRLTDKPGVIIT